MNFYFLLEYEKSLLKVLPHWLEYMNFGYTRVADIQEVEKNNYILQSGQGVTQLVTKALFDTINTIMANPGKIDILVIILDAEELDAKLREQQVKDRITSYYAETVFNFDIKIFVSNHCFETWLLGYLGLYPDNMLEEQSDFYPYYQYYNIDKFDPEKMLPPKESCDTIARFHFHYLHELLRYNGIRYSKRNPANVAKEEYFSGIVRRIDTTEHLKSFKNFYDFIYSVKRR